jgi:predicted small secreted protein
MITVRKLLALCVLCAFGFVATGCETMEGAGRDVKKAGDKIEDAAD